MSEQLLLEAIAVAQRVPAAHYVLWAGFGGRRGRLSLGVVRMPLGFSTEVSLGRLRRYARDALVVAGITGGEADAADLELERLPSAVEMKALLDPMVASGTELALLDFTAWEAARLSLGLEPAKTEFGHDVELDYQGLKIRRSVGS